MSIDALNSHSKITPGHLKKTAYLYIRQSTLRQVFENTESTQRQYALRQRAIVLGWPAEHIEIIDCDQGQSGASTAEREGFQKLVAEVGLGKAGIVMGLEVSRLARNCADWHRLLEICALSDTLILDEDGLYDPGHFNDRLGSLSPNYLCQQRSIEHAQRACQNIPGGVVDAVISALILESVGPLALEVAFNVQQELQERLAESDRLRRQYVERAQYEAEQARIRYMRVDPNNRLVADTLEALWNDKLRQLEQAREDCEKQRQSSERTMTREQKAQILALAEDFPRLWNDPGTSDRDRKRMARLILEDVTLNRDQTLITVQVRFKGGATKVLSLPAPPNAWQLRKTKAEIVAEIDRLLEQCTDSEVAAELNKKGWRSSANQPFSAWIIYQLRNSHKLVSRTERLGAKGFLNPREIAELIGSKPNLVDHWRQQGLLKGTRLNDKNEYLYERPETAAIQQIKQRTRLKDTNRSS